MTPVTPIRTIPLDVVEIGHAQAEMRGEFNLLQAEVRQAIQTLTTLVHDVQSEQLRAGQERVQQTLLLQGLTEKSSGFARLDNKHDSSAAKVVTLELELSHWRGVVKGALWAGGAAVTLAVGFLMYRLDSQDNRIQRLEVARGQFQQGTHP